MSFAQLASCYASDQGWVMSDNYSFSGSAKALARNPLGIIAFFIVLVYVVASIVISLAKIEFYHNPFHPAVLFLAVFRLIVLGAFAYVVARHHRNLYAPHDVRELKEFFFRRTVSTELEGNRSISERESVIYHVWHDFRNPVLSTSDAKSNFDLWLMAIYGEFLVLALINLRSGGEVEAYRYIDLPGRKPDRGLTTACSGRRFSALMVNIWALNKI